MITLRILMWNVIQVYLLYQLINVHLLYCAMFQFNLSLREKFFLQFTLLFFVFCNLFMYFFKGLWRTSGMALILMEISTECTIARHGTRKTQRWPEWRPPFPKTNYSVRFHTAVNPILLFCALKIVRGLEAFDNEYKREKQKY